MMAEMEMWRRDMPLPPSHPTRASSHVKSLVTTQDQLHGPRDGFDDGIVNLERFSRISHQLWIRDGVQYCTQIREYRVVMFAMTEVMLQPAGAVESGCFDLSVENYWGDRGKGCSDALLGQGAPCPDHRPELAEPGGSYPPIMTRFAGVQSIWAADPFAPR